MATDKTLRLAALMKVDSEDDEAEAHMILEDMIQTVRDRLEYWGVGLETESPYTLIGEIS